MPTKESKAEFDKLVAKYSPQVRALTIKTRAFVLAILPSAVEKTYFGWSNSWYGNTDKSSDAIFSISPQKEYVSLHFMRGTELPDPDGLLQGTGKKLRHVKIKSAAELKRPSLRKLARVAVAQSKRAVPMPKTKRARSKPPA
ncbi:MAG: DUF1801 domain-containing protein [Chloroflexi bacterium]|nr:DUF1801 domain-containing protein [Chloroflexota bacterium]